MYLFNAVSFAWSALLVWGLKPATPILPTTDATALSVEGPEGHDGSDTADEPTGLGRLFAGVGDGYREIFKNRDIRLLVGLYCAQTVVAGASAVAIVAIALDLLKLGNGGLGTLNATMGSGGLIGGLSFWPSGAGWRRISGGEWFSGRRLSCSLPLGPVSPER